MNELRQRVLDEAKTWLGTPFHHRAAVKKAGVDCGQFLMAVYKNAGLIEEIPETAFYPPDFHLHRGEEWYVEVVSRFCDETEDHDPGNIILFKQGRVFSHGAIIVEWPKIIHSYVGRGVQYAWGDQGRVGGKDARVFVPRIYLNDARTG